MGSGWSVCVYLGPWAGVLMPWLVHASTPFRTRWSACCYSKLPLHRACLTFRRAFAETLVCTAFCDANVMIAVAIQGHMDEYIGNPTQPQVTTSPIYDRYGVRKSTVATHNLSYRHWRTGCIWRLCWRYALVMFSITAALKFPYIDFVD